MNRSQIKEIGKKALRVIVYELLFGLIGILLVPSLLGASAVIRIALCVALIVIATLMFLTNAASLGETESAAADRLAKSAQKSNYHPSEAELASRYSVKKALLGALLGALPLFILCVLLALTTRPYVYTLQSYPTWLSSYVELPEIGGGIAYLNDIQVNIGIADYLRVAVRVVLFPIVGIFSDLSDSASLLFDRLTPIISLLIPAVFVIGYLLGPGRHAKEAKAIEEAKNKPRKRLKKEARRKLYRQRQDEHKELI